MNTQNNTNIKSKYEKVKVVMGWDIGDGDSVAYARTVTERYSSLEPLYTHKSRDTQVEKSAVAKDDNGTIIIGKDAAKLKNFVVNFKRSPKDWDNKSGLNVEYRQHMFDYIKGVSEAILQNSSNRRFIGSVITSDANGNVQWNKDEVLLAVGCPASVIWKGESMRKQYEALISEATGIQNVIVIEESRSAVFSLLEIDSLRDKVDIQKGVLVVDYGSSTADATYILPGRKTVNLSWELGAAKIEYAMMDYIIRSEKTQSTLAKYAKVYNKNRFLVARSSCSHVVFQLREDKEDHYDGKMNGDTVTQNVPLPVVDEDGNLIFDDDEAEAVTIAINYKVTEEMMQYAVDEYEFDAKRNGEIVSHGTWRQNCRRFLDDVRQTLEGENIFVETIVVTGGGSNMPFTVELCEKVFYDSWMVPSDARSHSVVKGLATIAYNEVKAPGIRDDAVEKIIKECREHIDKMIADITGNLSGKAYDAAVSALKSLTWNASGLWDYIDRATDFTDVGTITRKIDWAVNDSLKRNKSQEIKNSMKAWSDSDASKIVSVINCAASELYADKAIRDMVKINKNDVNAISSRVSIPNITMPDIAADANLIGAIVGYILSAVVFVILAFIAAIVPGIGPIFVTVVGMFAGSAIIEFFKKYEKTPVSLASVSAAVNRMEKQRTEKLNAINGPVRSALRDSLTKKDVYGADFEKHFAVLRVTANKAFDRILLISDDDQ